MGSNALLNSGHLTNRKSYIILTSIVRSSVGWIIDLEASSDAVLAILGREHDAQGEGSVGDVVVEIILKNIAF